MGMAFGGMFIRTLPPRPAEPRPWSASFTNCASVLPGAVGAGEFVSPCESGDNMGEPSTPDEQRGPLPLNKTLFLGYAFLLTMATTSDKLASRSKLPDGPSGSSEEEEGKALGSPGGFDICALSSFPFIL